MLDWGNWNWGLISFNFFSYFITLMVVGLHIDRQEKVASPWGKFLLGIIIFIIFVSGVTIVSYVALQEYYVSAIVYAGVFALFSIKFIIDIYNAFKEIDWKPVLKLLISPLFLGIYVFLLIAVLSVLYIPLVNQLWISIIQVLSELWISLIHVLSIGLGWLTATLFILSYLGLVIVLLMWFALKGDGRTRTGWSGNYTAEGSGSLLRIVIIMIVVGSVTRFFSTMPTWCEKFMCWPA